MRVGTRECIGVWSKIDCILYYEYVCTYTCTDREKNVVSEVLRAWNRNSARKHHPILVRTWCQRRNNLEVLDIRECATIDVYMYVRDGEREKYMDGERDVIWKGSEVVKAGFTYTCLRLCCNYMPCMHACLHPASKRVHPPSLSLLFPFATRLIAKSVYENVTC